MIMKRAKVCALTLAILIGIVAGSSAAYAQSAAPYYADAQGAYAAQGAPACDVGPITTPVTTPIMPGSVSGEAMFLFRQKPDSHTLVQDFASGGTDVLNVRDLAQDMGSGMRFTATLRPAWSDVEVSFFSVDNWSQSQSLVASSLVAYQLPDLNDAWTYNRAMGLYESKLYNGEVNVRCPLFDCLTGLIGFRWAELKENAAVAGEYVIDGAPELTVYSSSNSKVQNDLYGFQIGGDLAIGRDTSPLYVNAVVKGGVYGNQIRRQQDVVNGWDVTSSSLDQYDSRVSFMGEVALRATWEIATHLSVFGGYQALWISGVALAPDHLSVNATTISDDRTELFHGATAGFEARW